MALCKTAIIPLLKHDCIKLHCYYNMFQYILWYIKNTGHGLWKKIDNCKINEVKETKFLGVVIDNALKWSSHLEFISGNIAKGIGVIIKARKIFSVVTLLLLYNSHIIPYLSNCIHVLGKLMTLIFYDTWCHCKTKLFGLNTGVPPRTCHHRNYHSDIAIGMPSGYISVSFILMPQILMVLLSFKSRCHLVPLWRWPLTCVLEKSYSLWSIFI